MFLDDFRAQLKTLFTSYLQMVEAFVNSDGQQVEKEANNLLTAINQVNVKLVSGEAKVVWMEDRELMTGAANSIIESTEIADMRKTLPVISDQLYQSISRFQVATGGYRIFCPTALGAQGAYWLSNSREIRNPYLGDKMLNCGTVEEAL